MAIKFEELRKYVARNVRLSICFEDGYYHDYLMMSDIPEQKYAGFYIYGVGIFFIPHARTFVRLSKNNWVHYNQNSLCLSISDAGEKCINCI